MQTLTPPAPPGTPAPATTHLNPGGAARGTDRESNKRRGRSDGRGESEVPQRDGEVYGDAGDVVRGDVRCVVVRASDVEGWWW